MDKRPTPWFIYGLFIGSMVYVGVLAYALEHAS